MGEKVSYAIGYYDCCCNSFLDEKEIPKDIDSIKLILEKMADTYDSFESAVFQIGVSYLADRIMKGGCE